MNINELINDRYDPEKPMTDAEYGRLREKFFFNLPLVIGFNDPDPSDQELFERFLAEAEKRNEIFNPTYDHETH